MGLRIATKKDLKTVTDLYKLTIKDGYFKFPSVNMNRHISRKQAVVFEHDKKIIGCFIWQINKILNPITMKRGKNTTAWLEQIMVLPEYQGRGIGCDMMKKYLSIKVTEFRLVCNESLIGYYEQYGFEVVDTIISDKKQKVIMSRTA